MSEITLDQNGTASGSGRRFDHFISEISSYMTSAHGSISEVLGVHPALPKDSVRLAVVYYLGPKRDEKTDEG